MRRPTCKSWIVIIPLWLLIGAVVNIGVAWTFAISRERHDAIFDVPGLSIRNTSTRTDNLLEWPMVVPAHWPAIPTDSYTRHQPGSPAVHASHRALQDSATSDYSVTVTQSGWPLLSLMRWSTFARHTNNSADEIEFIDSRQFTIPWPDAWWGNDVLIFPGSMRLPVVPIWSGFIVNTLIYAAPIALLWMVPRAVRRFLRRQRGTCTACGYDLAGLPAGSICPECATSAPQS